MKQQTKLAMIGNVRRESDGATIKVRTHVNKGKQYPYASERQNTRHERRVQFKRLRRLMREPSVFETMQAIAAE